MSPRMRSSRPSPAHNSSENYPTLTRTPVVQPKYAASAFTTPSSGPSTRPLTAAKLIAGRLVREGRRGVTFSPNNETKLFLKDMPIVVPDSAAPPPSIRSYASPTATSSPSLGSFSSERGSSPSSIRPILKPIDRSAIRVARTLREGSWANKEPARRLVAGNRPRGMGRGASSSLAQLCDTAEDGVAARIPPSDDDVPGSDDSNPEAQGENGPNDSSDEEPEEIECLHPTSLVHVIMDGSEDLLTLEEAYCTLTLKVREALFNIGPVSRSAQAQLDAVVEPIADEAPSLVRAITRDLFRLMGKVPEAEQSDSSTPFRGLQPETRPTILPPSPGDTPTRKGYSSAEIRYRREASSVGAAALRFFAAVSSSPRLFEVFAPGDLTKLLDQVLMLIRTPVLPTPCPKRTYTTALTVLSHIRFPLHLIAPSATKILDALNCAWNTLGNGGPPYAFKDPISVRRDAFAALIHLLHTYPETIFDGYQQYLQSCLRSMSSMNDGLRRSASSALSCFVKTRFQLVSAAEVAVRFDRNDETVKNWDEMRVKVRRTELHTVHFLKSTVRGPAKLAGKHYCDAKEQKPSEWGLLEATFKALIGKQEDVAWGCSSWACIATLLGSHYNSFPHSESLDHIMDRSLQPSANSVRPALACAAWQHAIHSYLLAGSSYSISSEGRLVQSFNPFAASHSLDANARVQQIMFSFRVAIAHALNAKNFTRALTEFSDFRGEKRWTWKRSEKQRKFAWMVTGGCIAPAIVYAYTTLALDHEDQAAKEITRLSGLPSSDGIVADLTPEEMRVPRLDRTFELVLFPILRQSFTVCGVDALKNQAWSILEAVTAEPPSPAPRRSIDRLLSWRYLNGDVVNLDATDSTLAHELARAFEGDRIMPSEIPAWGKLWVAKRLGKLLALFVDAFDGIGGINELGSVQWVRNADGIVLLPQTLSRVWTNLLKAMMIGHVPDAPVTPLFKVGLYAVAKTLIDIFDREPVTYMPICLLNEEGQSTLSSSAVRLGVVLHLFRIAEQVLGERGLGSIQIESPIPPRSQVQEVDDAEAFGNPSVAGYLLKHILRSKHLAQPIDGKTREKSLMELVASLLKIGSSQNTRMLGHVANAMPWIFEGHERLQLDVWRTLALTWVGAVNLQPSDTAAKTNHTGDLLVSLLSCPFRNAKPDSVWYTAPAKEDLDAWDALLETTVLRFRAKRVGSNFGVLETLSAHFEDFILVEDEKTTKRRLTCATTLHCLAVASARISFVPTEHYHASHFSINENYVPVDFLSFVSTALDAAYPSAASSAVLDLVSSITDVFRGLPADSVPDVLEPFHATLAKWMAGKDAVAIGDLVHHLDELYIAVLSAITLSIESGSLPTSSETMNSLIDLYAPRLSCARSAAVPTAFQDFWRRSFQPVKNLDYSDDVAGFLADVLAAVPGLIIVEGLFFDESQATADKFPFAESVPSQLVQPEIEVIGEHAAPVDEDTRMDEYDAHHDEEDNTGDDVMRVDDDYEEDADEAVDLSLDGGGSPPPSPREETEYDGDVSLSQTQLSTQVLEARAKRKVAGDEILPASSSPAPSDIGSPDVFGPNKRTRTTRRGTRSRSVHSRDSSRASSPSPDFVNDTVIVGTDNEDEGLTPFRPTREALPDTRERPTFLASAGRWLRSVPSLGGLFAHEHVPPSVDAEYEDPPPAAEERHASWGISPTDGKRGRVERRLEPQPEEVAAKREPELPSEIPAAEAQQFVNDAAEDTEVDEPEPKAPKAKSAKLAEPTPRRTTRRSLSKQSTPALESTDSVFSSRRRSRRVAKEPPEVAPTRTTRSQRNKSPSVAPSLPSEPDHPRGQVEAAPSQMEESTQLEPEEAASKSKPAAPLDEETPSSRKVEVPKPEPVALVEELPPSRTQPSPPATRSRRKRPSSLSLDREPVTSKRLRASASESVFHSRGHAQAQTQTQNQSQTHSQDSRQNARAARLERRQKASVVVIEEDAEPAPVEPEAAVAVQPGEEEEEEVEMPAHSQPELAEVENSADPVDMPHEAPVQQEMEVDEDEVHSYSHEKTTADSIEVDFTQAEAPVEGIDATPAAHDDEDQDRSRLAEEMVDEIAIPEHIEADESQLADNTAIVVDDEAQPRDTTPISDASIPEPPTPTHRTVAQARLLSFLDEAAADETAIAELDFDGVVELLANVDRLRALATANLQAAAQEARLLRRTRTL